VLLESRQPGEDSLSTSVIEFDGPGQGSHPGSFGLVGYLHGAGVDRPLSVFRKSSTSIDRVVLHYGWQGAVDLATSLAGVTLDCGVVVQYAYGCNYIQWPGKNMSYGKITFRDE